MMVYLLQKSPLQQYTTKIAVDAGCYINFHTNFIAGKSICTVLSVGSTGSNVVRYS